MTANSLYGYGFETSGPARVLAENHSLVITAIHVQQQNGGVDFRKFSIALGNHAAMGHNEVVAAAFQDSGGGAALLKSNAFEIMSHYSCFSRQWRRCCLIAPCCKAMFSRLCFIAAADYFSSTFSTPTISSVCKRNSKRHSHSPPGTATICMNIITWNWQYVLCSSCTPTT